MDIFCWLLQCGNGGCLIELAQQLAVIMIGGCDDDNAIREIMIMRCFWIMIMKGGR